MPCQFLFAYFPPTLLYCAENILPQQEKKKKKVIVKGKQVDLAFL